MDMKAKIQSKEEINLASNIALWSIMNVTFLPVIAFIVLLTKLGKVKANSLAQRHLFFAIKLNIIAGFALVFVTILMLLFGGFYSGWTWVFVISYFVLVHTIFIIFSVWALIRAWAGNDVMART